MNLFDVTRGCHTLGAKPRNATSDEVRAYLQWIAARDGVTVPKNAEYHPAGVWSPTARDYIVAMPGHGQSQVVICELLDDAGEVIRSMPLPRDKRGGIPATAKQVQEWTGLKPVKAKRAKVGTPTVEVMAAPMATIASPEPAQDESAPIAAQDGPEVASAPVEAELPPVELVTIADELPAAPVADLDAITARLDALEQAIATLSAVQGVTEGAQAPAATETEIAADLSTKRSPAHERVIRRAWAERKARRAAQSIAEQAESHARGTDARADALRKEMESRVRHLQTQLQDKHTNMEKWAAEARKGRKGRARRIATVQRARRMIAAVRAHADLDRRALDITNATVARLKRDMADPSQPERASDIARLVQERDEARTALAAVTERAKRAEQGLESMADRFEVLVSRVTKAEAALRLRAA